MMPLVRFGVSIEQELLARFDREVVARGYVNRSEAIRDLIRERLVQEEWRGGEEVVGVITLVYDHHVRGIEARLTEIQHQHHPQVLSTMHVHLDHDNCLEVVAVKGEGERIAELAAKLIGIKGVRHGRLTATTTGRRLK
ncbi:TPA: nickel-responsive transcriptional regulator NikR [Candidatus Bipolaricaulota bacterium]|nr:nickel-responsive transcriptional regulator NikR [Candidatus Bipolaricaulota bacterium]